jgi:AraC family transcriptional regulator, positive regulator of tynA and feaB
MQPLFSTRDAHPRERFDYWHEVARRNIVYHDVQPDNRLQFEAEMEAGVLADVGFVRCTHSPLTISRTADHIARANTDDLFLCRQIAGTLALEQEGREAVLEAGDLTLIDPMLPYSGTFPSRSDLLILKLPRADLEARIGNIRRMVALAMKPLDPETSLASSFLGMLPAHVGKMNHVAEEVVKHQTIDLIALSLGNMIQRDKPRISSARGLVLLKVRAVIETRLSDPALDGKAVAAAAGVSVRYANSVLAEEGTSIARYIRERRLARCQRALEDPKQAHRSLSEIAYGWGFSDMTHFGRSFRKAYGILPSVYRKLASQTGSG